MSTYLHPIFDWLHLYKLIIKISILTYIYVCNDLYEKNSPFPET